MTDQLKLTLALGVVHGLKCRVKGEDKVYSIVGYNSDSNLVKLKVRDFTFRYLVVSKIDPLMHPVSRLTEQILPDGKIPIVELANKKYGENNFDPDLVMEELELSGWHNWPTWITDQLDAWHINYRGVEAVEIETSIND